MRKRVTLSVPGESNLWDSSHKEAWHVDFEKEPVNDERWTCFVSAAIESKAQDEEGIRIFQETAASGQRKCIKIIKMADVFNLLKSDDTVNPEANGKKSKKYEGPEKKKRNSKSFKEDSKSKTEMEELKESKKSLEFVPTRTFPIVELAKKYALFVESECILPPDLMAGVLKSIILRLKEENIFWRKVQMVREKRLREARVKANFIKSQLPFVVNETGSESTMHESTKDRKEPIQDEPKGGPDLYIVLTEFYNSAYFTQLLKMNVPFVAIFRVRNFKDAVPQKLSAGSLSVKGNTVFDKRNLITHFWERLLTESSIEEYNAEFRHFLLLEYQLPIFKSVESRYQMYDAIGEEFAWMLYSTYHIYRQHKSYLQEIFVQRMVRSLEPLDLSKCTIYNKLCDILVTGLQNTIYIIIYAIIEQLVAGLPHTDFVYEEFEPEFGDFISRASELDGVASDVYRDSQGKPYILVTPCLQCRNKKVSQPCLCGKSTFKELEKLTEVPNETTKAIKNFQAEDLSTESFLQKNLAKESMISETLLDEILTEKQKIKTNKPQKRYKLCFYGDKFYLNINESDPRIFDPKTIINRFLTETDVSQLWAKFPELSAADRAYYNHHYLRFEEICKSNRDDLKLKIAFVLTMKLLAITLSYFYKGEEDTKSEMFTLSYREKLKRLSRVKFEQRESFIYTKDNRVGFTFIVFKILNPENYHRPTTKKITPKFSRLDRFKSSFLKHESAILKKVTSHFNLYFIAHRISGIRAPHNKSIDNNLFLNSSFSSKDRDKDKELSELYSLIDCFDISNLSEPFLLNSKGDYSDLMKHFKFYENLEPVQMIQRFLKGFEEFNTIQCSHYSLTDNLFVILYNDHDHRGIFYNYGIYPLLTPIGLRDFYNCLYSDIHDWLIIEQEEYEKFVNNIKKQIKAQHEIEEEMYLKKLEREFNAMNEIRKNEFLNMHFVELVQNRELEVEVNQEDLRNLPIKPKYQYPNSVSYITTNLCDIRVETHKKLQEYHSPDGTKVTAVIDSWLYDPISLLTITVKKGKLKFYYHNRLGNMDSDSQFSLKSDSGIIFVFYQNEVIPRRFSESARSYLSEDTTISKISADTCSKSEFSVDYNYYNHYHVKMSWPTGLLIETVSPSDSSLYIKQRYLEVYRKGREIHDEKLRCFLSNGQILLFRESGDVEVLCASGEKYILKEFSKNKKDANFDNEYLNYSITKFQHVSPLGEVWEENKKQYNGKRKLTEVLKINIGTDSKTKETFYRRDDGVNCMLWPNGKLVTIFPDGTKITSTPDFDDKEIEINWSEEEKLYFQEMKSKSTEETNDENLKGKTILRKSTIDSISISMPPKNFQSENFVSVSLTYLMEHPKYSTVFFDTENDSLEIKMPKEISMKIQSKNKIQIKQGKTDFFVKGDVLQFTTNCPFCRNKSTAKINLKGKEILCEFFDFFGNVFRIFRNGETVYRDFQEVSEEGNGNAKGEVSGKCHHMKPISEKQKCFVLERDLSGTEFIHNDTFARQCFKLPADTYYDLDSSSTKNNFLTHLFSIPYYKIGSDKWEMEYEDKNSTLPTNLKKKDLKELDAKETGKNRFKYPFPNNQATERTDNDESIKKKCAMPKYIVTRVIKCLASSSKSLTDEFQRNVATYQNKALRIYREYKKRKLAEEPSADLKSNFEAEEQLNYIAFNINQSQYLSSPLCYKAPLNTRDLHSYNHSIDLKEKIKEGMENRSKEFLLCKYIQGSLPRITKLESISEEIENEYLRDETVEDTIKN